VLAWKSVAGREGTSTVQIGWADGLHQTLESEDDLAATLVDKSLDDVLSLRMQVRAGDDTMAGVLVARQKIPGVLVEVVGPDPARVLGATELIFQRLMIGYVDRMGGLRGLWWQLIALAPIFLVGLVLNESGLPRPLRLAMVITAAVGGFVAFYYSQTLLLFSVPFVLLTEPPVRFTRKWLVRLISIYRHRYTKPALAILGSLLLGIVGNKIADAIPFP
jgi:hypothetical protein